MYALDVCRAILHCTNNDKVPRSSVWNICDKNDTDQGNINQILEAMFKIRCNYWGRIVSNLAAMRIEDVTNHANEKHLKPWTDLCLR